MPPRPGEVSVHHRCDGSRFVAVSAMELGARMGDAGSPGNVGLAQACPLKAAGMGMRVAVWTPVVDIYVDWLWFGEVGFRSVWIASRC